MAAYFENNLRIRIPFSASIEVLAELGEVYGAQRPRNEIPVPVDEKGGGHHLRVAKRTSKVTARIQYDRER